MLKRQLWKGERRHNYQRGRVEKKSAQDSMRDSLPLDLPNQRRVHLLKSKYGPKFVKKGHYSNRLGWTLGLNMKRRLFSLHCLVRQSRCLTTPSKA